ncbi:putative hexose transporter protein [Ilyonectria robusta]
MGFSKSNRLMLGVMLTAIFNGCTMGFDQAMMGSVNALDQYTEYFSLSSDMIGLNVAIINAGSIIGGLFAGQFSDAKGRKWGIALSAMFTALGVAIQASAVHQAMFCVGRFLLGVAITVNATAAPIWVMEMAHPKHKGWMGGLYMASWYLAATVASGLSLRTSEIPNTWAWRTLSLAQAVPSLLAISILPFMPESPRWLVYHGKYDEAYQVLKDVHSNGSDSELIAAEFKEIHDTINFEKENNGTWRALIAPKSNARRFILVVLVNIFAQIVGANTVSLFISEVLDVAGVTETRTQLTINLGMNVWNLACAVVGSFLADAVGRKAMLLWATVSMTLFLSLMAVLSAVFGPESNNQSGKIANVAIAFLLLGSYSIAWTPLTYTYPVEVLNYSQRAKGVALGHSICFVIGFINQYTTPIAISEISWKYYIINACWNVVVIGLIWSLFVETKGMTLEEVDEIFDGVVHTEGVRIGTGDHLDKTTSPKGTDDKKIPL